MVVMTVSSIQSIIVMAPTSNTTRYALFLPNYTITRPFSSFGQFPSSRFVLSLAFVIWFVFMTSIVSHQELVLWMWQQRITSIYSCLEYFPLVM
jgi:subtilase family serine protease